MNNWKRLGFTDEDLTKPGSDRFIDAVVAYGTPDEIAARLSDTSTRAPTTSRSRCSAARTNCSRRSTELAGPLGLI